MKRITHSFYCKGLIFIVLFMQKGVKEILCFTKEKAEFQFQESKDAYRVIADVKKDWSHV